MPELIELLQATDIKEFHPILTNENLAILNNEDIYTNVTEQNIYKINTLYNSDNKVIKIKKGYRNNMLFNWGMTIKNINPDICIEDLAKHIYWLYIFRCEKSDDFDMYQVCTIAISIFKTDIEDYKDFGKRKYLIHPEKKKLSRSEKSQALGKARRKTRDNNILPSYDFNKSLKENAKELNTCENTIRSCFEDNGVKTPNQEKYNKFIEVYKNQPDATIRQLTKLTGLSDKTVQKYKTKYKKQFCENL